MRAQSPTFIHRDWKSKPTYAEALYARTNANRYLSGLEIQANLCEILVCAHSPQPLLKAIKNSSQLVRDPCMRAQPPTVIYRDWKFKPTCARSLHARTIPNRHSSRLEIQANLCEILVCARNPQPLLIAIGNSCQLLRGLFMRAKSPNLSLSRLEIQVN